MTKNKIEQVAEFAEKQSTLVRHSNEIDLWQKLDALVLFVKIEISELLNSKQIPNKVFTR